MADANTPDTEWDPDDLDRVDGTEEIQLSSTRPDGSDRPFVTIWAVRAGTHVYVRSAYGPENGWHRRALRSGTGRISVGGVERAVTFTRVDPSETSVHAAVDDAFRSKYERYPASYIDTVVGDLAQSATLRLDPR